jgi:hypothetical protein
LMWGRGGWQTAMHFSVMGFNRDASVLTFLLERARQEGPLPTIVSLALEWGNLMLAKTVNSYNIRPLLETAEGRKLLETVKTAREVRTHPTPRSTPCARPHS